MKTLKVLSLVFAVCCLIASVSLADEGKDESGKGKKRPPEAQDKRGDEQGSYFHQHGYTRLDIPKGHYPSPGECRIWYPDRPAGQQPPPVKCSQLKGQVPPGAWLIQHPDNDPKHVNISVYDKQRPGSIVITGEFEIDTGKFIRELRKR